MKKLILYFLSFIFISSVQSQAWSIVGNANTNPAIHFLGTTNNNPLKIRINNNYAGEIDSVSGKTFLGYGAGKNSSVTGNSAFGYFALNANTTGTFNTAIGYYALSTNTTASNNTGVGNRALFATTTGADNTATGYRAMYWNTTGFNNTASGSYALYYNTTGNGNTATGYYSLNYNTTGYFNTAHGTYTLERNTSGSSNTAVGYGALNSNSQGGANCAIGVSSLVNNLGGSENTAIGRNSLVSNTDGSNNTALGSCALLYVKNSNYNTAIGAGAGATTTLTGDMGNNNVLLGGNTNGTLAGQTNFIVIGYGVTAPASNSVRIGNSAIGSIGGYANWTNFSDGRYKKNISEDVKGLEFIMKLRPVIYNLDISGASRKSKENAGKEWDEKMKEAIAEKEQTRFTGFVAQEVEQAAKEIGYDFSGVDRPKNENSFYGLRYAEFVVPLVKAMQEQQALIDELRKQNAGLQARIDAIERKQAGNNSMQTKDPEFSVWPNPTHDVTMIVILAERKSQGNIKIFDSKGALVKQQQIVLSKGKNQSSIDIKEMPKGVYHVAAEWSDGNMKRTTIIVKE